MNLFPSATERYSFNVLEVLVICKTWLFAFSFVTHFIQELSGGNKWGIDHPLIHISSYKLVVSWYLQVSLLTFLFLHHLLSVVLMSILFTSHQDFCIWLGRKQNGIKCVDYMHVLGQFMCLLQLMELLIVHSNDHLVPINTHYNGFKSKSLCMYSQASGNNFLPSQSFVVLSDILVIAIAYKIALHICYFPWLK